MCDASHGAFCNWALVALDGDWFVWLLLVMMVFLCDGDTVGGLDWDTREKEVTDHARERAGT